jgi:hypothetical protein
MRIESGKHRMDVHHSELLGSLFDDLDMSGWRVHNVNFTRLKIRKANLAGPSAAIDGIAVADLLAYWQGA